MIYEKHLNSSASLAKQLSSLDGDAGVRVLGAYKGVRCIAFTTRFHERYTVIVHEAEGRGVRTPGKELASMEFDGVASVMAFLRSVAGKSVDAYAY